MSSGDRNRIIIASAGLVGIIAALLLGRHEIPFVLIEADEALAVDLRASKMPQDRPPDVLHRLLGRLSS